MQLEKPAQIHNRTVVIGAGMAGIAAAISLAVKGEEVILLETASYPGGKMRKLATSAGPVDSGPTVFTMKYVFDALFASAGKEIKDFVDLKQASVLARHAWNGEGFFDLHADKEKTTHEIGEFFGKANADGYQAFCKDSGAIFDTLKDTFIGAQRPGPIDLGLRVGLTNFQAIANLRPLQTLWSSLGKYFPDPRLQQLFGRYATYVGSSPYMAPATLMLIAHVEQEGVWFVEGGMHELAKGLEKLAVSCGVKIRKNASASNIIVEKGKASGVILEDGEIIVAKKVIYCGDISNLWGMITQNTRQLPKKVEPSNRSLSAITWSLAAKTKGFPLQHHNVFFSDDYKSEFDQIFKEAQVPKNPTVYICAQDRHEKTPNNNSFKDAQSERLLCLINAPALGDRKRFSKEDMEKCQANMTAILRNSGLELEIEEQVATQPADFNQLFPGSGGALYGRASHGWTASFARPGSKTKIPGLYLAGGSVHPGPGVPMATLSGMLAAQQIIKDHALI